MHEDCNNRHQKLEFGSLFVFGLIENALVDWMESKGYEARTTWALVALGVAATVAISYIFFDRRIWTAGRLFIHFLCSGIPMIVGDILRDAKEDEEIRANIKIATEAETERMHNNERGEPAPAPTLTTTGGR